MALNLSLAELTLDQLVQILSGVGAVFCLFLFLLELAKFRKYRSHSEMLDFSGIGVLVFSSFAVTGDLLLTILLGLLAMMFIGVYEVRESPVWVRLMASFTITYGFVLATYIFSTFVQKDPDKVVFGLGWNFSLWILLITSFIFFGKRFLLVSRFMSPQIVYLVVYAISYVLILQLGLDWQLRYGALFIANVFLYMISGPLLTFLFGIKPLDDPRVTDIVKDVEEKIETKVRKIGFVKAPILNAFAYGPWFDQRIALMASNPQKYTEAEIRGIAAHEVAHLKKKHTLWLLVLGFGELAIKLILNVPASYLDYAVGGQGRTLSFLDYYIFNLLLFVGVLYIFVRIMEGQADRLTAEAGYGKDLAQSLFRLEGFYQGIAGELGLSATLLTGKERTPTEDIRFMGDAARSLQKTLVSPSRGALIGNLIMSHPLSAFRIAAIVDNSISTLRLALFPFLLMLPKLRKRSLKILRRNREKVSQLLNEKFLKDFGSVEVYVELSKEKESSLHYVGRTLLAIPRSRDGKPAIGKANGIEISDSIVSPLQFKFEDTNLYSPSDFELYIFEQGTPYFLKNGKIATLIGFQDRSKGNRVGKIIYEADGASITLRSLGIPVADLPKAGEKSLLLTEGMVELVTINKVKLGSEFTSSEFEFKRSSGEVLKLTGKELILNPPPQFTLLSKRGWDRQKSIFEWLESGIPVLIFEKEDPEIPTPVQVLETRDNGDLLVRKDRVETTISFKKIDALILEYPIMMFRIKREVGWGTIFTFRMANRFSRKVRYLM